MDFATWSQGIPLEEYAQSTGMRHRLSRKLAEVKLPDEVRDFFESLSVTVYGLVITENWCPTTPVALAVLIHCRELSHGRLDVRVFKRDAYPALMDQFLKDGKYRAIPVVAFFDEQFHLLGDIREKPSLPEWATLDPEERPIAEAGMDWSELWGRAYMAILRQHIQAGVI